MFSFVPKQSFLVGIDSDGCAFDTMELKHKECFIPSFIKHFRLQGVSKYAREAAEFVNLYSKDRGCNRFLALIKQLGLLAARAEVLGRKYDVQVPPGVVAWTKRETKLANPTLEAEVAAKGDPDLRQALEWSKEVNERIAEMVEGVPPFPLVRECLTKLQGHADVLVVSATPNEALQSEWQEHGIAELVEDICGQEVGSKKEILQLAIYKKKGLAAEELVTEPRQYPHGQSLMIGDAPGDHDAAKGSGCWFFPINPGAEEESWKRLHDEGLDLFLTGKFDEAYQKELNAEFDKRLPETPSW